MTSERDFDRIARAWLDMGPNEAPDRTVAAVLQAVESMPQSRRPIRWPFWRPAPMSRLPVLAVLAGLIVIILGALALSGGSQTPVPSPSAVPSPAPAAIASPGPLPDELVGGWVGPMRDQIEQAPDTISILFGALDGNASAPDFFVSGPAFTPNLQSTIEEPEPGVIRMTLEGASPDCSKDDVGTYRWSISPDGQWLTTELIDDVCADRSEVVPGSWQRSLAVDSHGGPGIVTNFLPFLQFTLPAGTYVGNGAVETDTINIDSPGYSFKVWKDLDGFVDPCDIDAGRIDLDPGMDGFLAYLTGDPRFTVTSQDEFQIDGHRAVEVQFRIGKDITPPCWTLDGNPDDLTGVLTWNPHSGGGSWNAPIDSPGMLVVTEVDGTSLVFEPVTDSGDTWTIDRAVLDTVRFLDALPTPPAS